MSKWFQDTKDGDKIALLLLFIGVLLVILGAGATMAVIVWIRDESKLDRGIIALATLGAQGSGLITAAMGVLRFQSKSTNGGTNPATAPGFITKQ